MTFNKLHACVGKLSSPLICCSVLSSSLKAGVLFDALEDAAFRDINDMSGAGSLKQLELKVIQQSKPDINKWFSNSCFPEKIFLKYCKAFRKAAYYL